MSEEIKIVGVGRALKCLCCNNIVSQIWLNGYCDDCIVKLPPETTLSQVADFFQRKQLIALYRKNNIL